MRAAVYTRYGPPEAVVEVRDAEKPVPGENEVVIAVEAAAVNPLDAVTEGRPWTLRIMTGLRRPKVTRLGVDVAGLVEAAGAEVTGVGPGERVFGWCVDDVSGAAVWVHSRGAFAEYACVPAAMVTAKPDNVTPAQAAAAPVAAVTALQGLRDRGGVQQGQTVLVNGAAGGVGTFAVQIAKWLGAQVTAVCSTANVDMVRSIGADHVIDYTLSDFTSSKHHYDVIIDCIGNHPLSACRRVLAARGTYVAVGGPSSRWVAGLLARPIAIMVLSPFVRQKLVTFVASPSPEDLATIRDLMAAGKVTPVIDRCYGLDEVSEAMRYQQAKHARGKVVIQTQSSQN
ncbi:MAG TPA: NAD(P)-dependent alcohol dehydrogenase [Streptosporangiaceae bacterium]|nr:NAD(P)-dependent alcohol dehydrogenase [Streptosporangiaceae bacterium]